MALFGNQFELELGKVYELEQTGRTFYLKSAFLQIVGTGTVKIKASELPITLPVSDFDYTGLKGYKYFEANSTPRYIYLELDEGTVDTIILGNAIEPKEVI